MLPSITTLAAVNVVPVKIVVSIDVDIAAVPIAVTPPTTDDTRANDDARPPGESHSWVVARV
jgi:hypothetical protein